MRCLVTGATGYIGSRLVPQLLAAGHAVRCLTRSADKLRRMPWVDQVEIAEADLADRAGTAAALRGVEVGYYLVHSMGKRGFEAADRTAATNFAAAARAAGLARIIYLGGPQPRGTGSAHLRSRAEVAEILAGSGVATVVFRAAVIIGSGSTSFEMLRHLTERLPVMVTPRWVHNRVQPIAIADVLHYLVAGAGLPAEVSRGFDIGGPQVLTYGDMMRRYAAITGLRRRLIIPVRPLTPRLSSYWVGLVTPVPAGIAKPLVASLVHEAVAREHDIARYLPDPPGGLTSFEDAVRAALATGPDGPARSLPSDPAWAGATTYTEVWARRVAVPPGTLWQAITALATRLDTWVIEQVTAERLLRLRSDRRLPGQAWLELAALPGPGDGSRYLQRLRFRPRGLAGLAFWAVTRPAYVPVLSGLARTVVTMAERTAIGVRPDEADRTPAAARSVR